MLYRLIDNLFRLAFGLLGWILLWPFALLRRRARHFVRLDLKDGFHLAPRRTGLLARRARAGTYSALDEALNEVERSGRAEGVVLHLHSPRLTLADADMLRTRLERTRAKGKRVVVHLDSGGPTDALLSQGADTVLMSPPGRIMLLGFQVEMLFLRRVLERLGLRGQFLHLGRYKTAGHMFTRDGTSEAQRENATALVTDLRRLVCERLAPDTAPDAGWPFDLPLYDVGHARRAGLITHRAYPEQVAVTLQAEAAEGDEPFDPMGHYGDDEVMAEHVDKLDSLKRVKVHKPKRFRRLRPRPIRLRPLRARKEIVVVEMAGMIVDDPAETGGVMARSSQISPAPVRKLFKQLRQDRGVVGVVVTIDSRGGSALASDLIWREMRRLRATKPVVAYMRSVAASGGYYIAVGADEIISNPLTITGSIGVVMGKFSIDQALDRAEVGREVLLGTAFAGLLSPRQPFTAPQIEALRADLRRAYQRFVSRVGVGRPLRHDQIHELARGRVYTGVQAAKVGLVDATGGLESAVERVAELAEYDRKRLRVSYESIHKRSLFSAMQGATAGSELGALGTLAEPLADALSWASLVQSSAILAYCDVKVSSSG